MSIARLFLLHVIATLAVLAAACGGDSTPTPAPPASAPTATTMPADAMMEKTPTPMMDKTPEAMATPGMMTDSAMMAKLPEQRFAAHFVSSMPAHGDALMGIPEKVVLKFNFTLGGKTSATVTKDGKDLQVPPPQYSPDKLTMELALPAGSGEGLYIVDYDACWPDGSCHKGLFGFTVGEKAAMAAKDAMMDKTPAASMTDGAMATKTGEMMGKLPEQKFAAHFVDSVPAHSSTFAAAPARVVINFDFVLGQGSAISLSKDGQAVAAGPTELTATTADRKLSMQSSLPGGSGDGMYVVSYKACWPDGSCHDGVFAFMVDSKTASAYKDMTGSASVNLDIRNIAFAPERVAVSKGTKVTWTNHDAVIHFVNTDPHPTHNFEPGLNSLELRQGEGFSYTFSQPGEYAYHCSAHTNMVARVLVK